MPQGTRIGAVVGGDVGAAAAVVPAHPPGLGGQSGDEHHGGEGESDQCFHCLVIFCCRPVFSAGGGCRQFQVCSLERPSPASSQTRAGLLQVFRVMGDRWLAMQKTVETVLTPRGEATPT